MHLTGKILAWLLIPFILGGMVLTAKLVKVRNSWTAKLEKDKLEYAKLAPQVVEAQYALEKAQAEWHRATEAWGSFHEKNVLTTLRNAAGDVSVTLGPQQVQQGQWLYGFEVRPEGAVYRGDFFVAEVRDGGSLLRPNWLVREGDTDGWQSGTWRWRVIVPPSYSNRFDELQQAFLRQAELYNDRQQTLAVHQELLTSAQEQLKLREAELIGGPELPQDEALDLEFRQGLVAAVEELTERRDAELRTGDRLRRTVRELNTRIQATHAENQELVKKLPQPATEVSKQP